MAISDNMRAIRIKKGLTQKQVAAACGLADSTVRTYELGNANPKPASVAKLAKALGVSAAELYGVDWMPGIVDVPDQETKSALYQSVLEDPLPIDGPSRTRLLVAFDKLNADGQLEAIKRTEELTQVPVYQAAQPGFSSDEIEKLHHFIQTIQNQQLELSMMAEDKRKNESALRSSRFLIDDATKGIINIVSKHLTMTAPEYSDT